MFVFFDDDDDDWYVMLINEWLFVAKLGMLTNRATQTQLFQTQMMISCDAKV
jgi:hypothetical protein